MTLKEKMQKKRNDKVNVSAEELQEVIKQIKDKFCQMQEKNFTKKEFSLYVTWSGSNLTLFEFWGKTETSKKLLNKCMDDTECVDILQKIAKYMKEEGADVATVRNNRLDISITLS